MEDLIDKVIGPCRTALKDSGLKQSEIDEVVATLNGMVRYSAGLAELPAGVALPVDMPQLVYIEHDDPTTSRLEFTGVMTVDQQGILFALSADAAYQTALTELFKAPRRFVQRNMRSYSIEHFKTPLAILPDITFPVEIKEYIYHDAEAELLYFVGAMSEEQKEVLLKLPSTDADFTTAITNLFAAPDSARPENVFLSHKVEDNEDTDALFLSPETLPSDRFVYVLSKLMPHLFDLLSARAVIQRLAEAFELETRTTHELLTKWLDRVGHDDQRLLAAFLDHSFAYSNTNATVTRGAFSDQFDAFLRLQKVALIVTHFECTALQIEWLFSYAAAGWPDLAALPLREQPTSAVSFDAWLNLIELFARYGLFWKIIKNAFSNCILDVLPISAR